MNSALDTAFGRITVGETRQGPRWQWTVEEVGGSHGDGVLMRCEKGQNVWFAALRAIAFQVVS